MVVLRERFFYGQPRTFCEMKAVDWFHTTRSLSHLCDLEIPKPAGHGEVDLLIGSDYDEELLLPLEHRVGKPGEPVGVGVLWVLRCHSDGQLLGMFPENWASVKQPAMQTRSMRTLLQKC